MCPSCISTALLLLTGGSSAGGLTLFASRLIGTRSPSTRTQDSEELSVPPDQGLKAEATRSLG
jgi:hypothetical protein